jgi:DDE superfamily endonuclease
MWSPWIPARKKQGGVTTALSPPTSKSHHYSMPRISKRARAIRDLEFIARERLTARQTRTTFDEEDPIADGVDLVVMKALQNAHSSRYLFRERKYRKGSLDERFGTDLLDQIQHPSDTDDTEGVQPWLNESEFIQKYRMSRSSFDYLLNLIKDHPVFHTGKKKKQAPVEFQLMTWLRYVGTEGSGASNANQRHSFGIGYGTADLYRDRVTTAIRSLSKEWIHWPDEEERKKIGFEMLKVYGFPHCVSIADGTLFPLAFEPETLDAPDYSGRKYGYSLTAMIFCDHKRRVRHYLSGFPGSAHDNRVYKATMPGTDPNSHFADREYCIGDSAFENSPYMVSAFKKPKGQSIPKEHERFNEKLARLRIISEHCIGILKGRFPWLRSIRLKVTEDKKSMRRILRLLDATIVVHNILIHLGEKEREDWIDHDNFLDLDDAERAPYEEGDALNMAIPIGAAKDERRTRLMYYFEEHHYFT